MRTWHAMSVVALVTATSGCAISVEPIGDASPSMEPAEWNGVWVDAHADEGPATIVVEVTDRQGARFVLTWLNTDDGHPTLESTVGVMRSLDGDLFVNLEQRDESGTLEGYLPFRISRRNQRVLAWSLDDTAIRALVAKGVLPGTLPEERTQNVVFGPLDAQHLELFSGDRAASILEWDAPLVFERVGQD